MAEQRTDHRSHDATTQQAQHTTDKFAPEKAREIEICAVHADNCRAQRLQELWIIPDRLPRVEGYNADCIKIFDKTTGARQIGLY